MSTLTRAAAAALSSLASPDGPAGAQASGGRPRIPRFRLYLAATAAAEASLRLHETAAARRWLDEAPPAHRGWEWRYLSAPGGPILRPRGRTRSRPGRRREPRRPPARPPPAATAP